MEVEILNIKGKKAGTISLPVAFGVKPSAELLHEVVVGYLANQRSGTHSTKTKSEVSGGGIKPWRQKGTGRARSGSTRSPLWRKGGITFGPKPRDYSQKMSKNKRDLALRMALSAKAQGNNLLVIDNISIAESKTKNAVQILKDLNVNKDKILIVLNKKDDKLVTATKNLENVAIAEFKNINAYQVLQAEKLIIEAECVKQIKTIEE